MQRQGEETERREIPTQSKELTHDQGDECC